ncbi:hypothetical protein KKF81_03070 [Candidatus Micrarchaeota archaeon]|nr:hypothetical protein [Candidatus Micrarchaeota archaeon]MBU1165904.1 hypothetical protein [Candidatus Micrarchaeota archaeon]MBU1887101.1 hypothetical protein [Candidatus Micrarchaeota archaeon]
MKEVNHNSGPHYTWHHTWSRNYGVQYGELLLTSMTTKCNGAASILKHHLLYPDNKNIGHFIRGDDWDKFVVAMEIILSDEVLIDKEISLCKSSAKDYIDFGKMLSKVDLKNCSNLELLTHYNSLLEKWTRYTVYLWSFFILNEILCPKSERFLQEKRIQFDSEEKFDDFVKYFTSPIEKSSILKLNHELREVKNSFSETKLKAICKRYLWVPCLDIHLLPWDENHLMEYFETHDFAEVSTPDSSILDKLNLTDKELKFISINRKMTYMKDLRDEYRRKGVYYSQKLFLELATRMGIDLTDTSFLTIKEITDFLTKNTPPDKTLIAERRSNGFMIFEKNDQICCVCGSDEIALSCKEFGFTKSNRAMTTQEISGIIGSKGKATGTVKIIVTEDDLHKISKGDVIVALTTNPAYTPAMAKAVAFVTDQGGITCHAAIVAREMKKPCIIGTQNATSILKDGDLVEVDADNGKVRKL